MSGDLNFKAVNLLLALALVLHRAPVIKNSPYDHFRLLLLYIAWCCISATDLVIKSEILDLVIILGLGVHLTILRSQMTAETVRRPIQNDIPSSTLAHDRLALLALASIVLGVLKNVMVLRAFWFGEHVSTRRWTNDGLPQLFQWLQYQVQYTLGLLFLYRVRTLGVRTREEYARQLFFEVSYYHKQIYMVIPLFIIDAVLNTMLMDGANSQDIVLLCYIFTADFLLYGLGLVALELTLIYMDLTACGYSRLAVLEHFSDLKLESIFSFKGKEQEHVQESF